MVCWPSCIQVIEDFMRHEEGESHGGSASALRFVLDGNDDMMNVLS